ncbi:MAG: DUF2723 domain-containing protein [bacterium]|nr:DUF2723 domain-containing protein [bacterium]
MQERSPITKKQYLIGLFVFFISYSIYLLIFPSTVTFGDSGDFITSAYVLGIPHPSGYPLYTLINHLFSYIPISNIGMRITLSSAIFASLTSIILYFLFIKLQVSTIFSISTALSFSFSWTFFRVAGYSKTYAMYAFFSILLIFLLILWQETINPHTKYLAKQQAKSQNLKSQKWFLLFSFILGLSFTNHNLMATLIPGILSFIFLVNKKVFSNARLLITGFWLFILGLSIFLYLPIRAFQHPPIDWANPTTLSNFIDCIMVKFAQKRFFDVTLLKMLFMFKHYFLLVARQFLIFGFLSILGLYILYQNKKEIFFLLFSIILVNTGLSLIIYTDITPGMVDYESYHLPSFLCLAIGLGIGLNFFKKNRKICYLSLLIPVVICVFNYYPSNKSRFFFAYDYGRNLLRELPSKTLLFTYTDHEFMTLWYLRFVENRREDIIQLNLYDLTTAWVIERITNDNPSLIFTGEKDAHYLFKLENLVKNNIDRFNIFYTFSEDMYNPGYKIAYSSSLSSYGMLFRVEKYPNAKIEELPYVIRGLKDKIYKDTFTKDVLKIYGYAYGIAGSKHLADDPKKARDRFELASILDPENEIYKKGIEYAEGRIK